MEGQSLRRRFLFLKDSIGIINMLWIKNGLHIQDLWKKSRPKEEGYIDIIFKEKD